MLQGYSFFVVGDDGHFKRRIDVVCVDDAEAKNRAEQMLDGQIAIEVWQGVRRVLMLRPEK